MCQSLTSRACTQLSHGCAACWSGPWLCSGLLHPCLPLAHLTCARGPAHDHCLANNSSKISQDFKKKKRRFSSPLPSPEGYISKFHNQPIEKLHRCTCGSPPLWSSWPLVFRPMSVSDCSADKFQRKRSVHCQRFANNLMADATAAYLRVGV